MVLQISVVKDHLLSVSICGHVGGVGGGAVLVLALDLLLLFVKDAPRVK